MIFSHVAMARMRRRGVVPTHRLFVRLVLEHRQCMVCAIMVCLVVGAWGVYPWWVYLTLPEGVPPAYVAMAASRGHAAWLSLVFVAVLGATTWIKEQHYQGLLRDMPWREMPPVWITFLQPKGLWWVVGLRSYSVTLLGPQGQQGICSFFHLAAALQPAGDEEAA